MSEINILDAILGEIEDVPVLEVIFDDIPVIEVEMTNPIYRGPAGRDGADGKDGKPGKSGVYLGDTEPEDEEINVWIDPDAETEIVITEKQLNEKLENYPTKEEVSKLIPEVDLSDYATIDQVNKAISAIPEPDLSPYQTAEQVETAINNALSSIGVAEAGEY